MAQGLTGHFWRRPKRPSHLSGSKPRPGPAPEVPEMEPKHASKLHWRPFSLSISRLSFHHHKFTNEHFDVMMRCITNSPKTSAASSRHVELWLSLRQRTRWSKHHQGGSSSHRSSCGYRFYNLELQQTFTNSRIIRFCLAFTPRFLQISCFFQLTKNLPLAGSFPR